MLNDESALNLRGPGVRGLPALARGPVAFADEGFRPVDPDVLAENEDKYPIPSGLFTIDDFW